MLTNSKKPTSPSTRHSRLLPFRHRSRQRGGVLVIVAAATVALLGVTAWVVDISWALQSRTHQQAAADAGALAGVYHLYPEPYDEAAVKQATLDFVTRNRPGANLSAADVTIANHPTYNRPYVNVRWTDTSGTLFGRIFNVGAMNVGVQASAIAAPLGEFPNHDLMPWGLPAYNEEGTWHVMDGAATAEEYVPVVLNETIVRLKTASGNNNKGNFMALDLGGTGANSYEEDIINGSTRQLSVGEWIPTQTGNMVGPTDKAVAERLASGRDKIYIPLINKDDWDAAKGKSEVRVIGFITVQLYPSNKGEVVGRAIEWVSRGDGDLNAPGDIGPGAYAPVLIPTPQQ